jgi:hypothetical protein
MPRLSVPCFKFGINSNSAQIEGCTLQEAITNVWKKSSERMSKINGVYISSEISERTIIEKDVLTEVTVGKIVTVEGMMRMGQNQDIFAQTIIEMCTELRQRLDLPPIIIEFYNEEFNIYSV